jgi:hypothetical protein
MSSSGGATFDTTGAYRYRLWREWDDTLPRVCFVMLNPSVADAGSNDPTVRRCIGFARAWGFGVLDVVNLFALRTPRPADLRTSAFDPIGPENNDYLTQAFRSAACVVAAWGVHGALHGRDRAVLPLLPSGAVCFGHTRGGHPLHPLYLPSAAHAVSPVDRRTIHAAATGQL